MSLFEKIKNKIIIESSSDTTGKNKKNRNRKKQFSSNISRTVNPSDLDPDKLRQQEIPIDFSKTGKEDPVKGVKSPRDIIGNKKKQGRPFGSKNKPKETDPLKQLTLDDIKKERAPRKGVDYFFDPDKAKADREKLISKRKEYEIDRKGNISKRGVEKYARQIKQSNLPLTKKDLSNAKRFAVGGEKITDSSGKVIGTTTGKYGGNLARKRPSNAKSLEQIQKEIDSRPPDGRIKPKKVKVSDKELQDVLKTGRKTKPGRTKKITVGSLDARDKAIKDLDDLIIEPKAGDVKQTEKLIKRQRKRVVKRITTPKADEVSQSERILKKFNKTPETKMDLSKPIKDPWFTDKDDYPNAFDGNKNKPETKSQKVLTKVKDEIKKKKIKTPPKFAKPSTTGLYDPLKNKIPDLTKLKPLRVPKLAPSTLKTTVKTGTRFQRMMRHLGKNRNPYLKGAAGLALLSVGTYGALKNRKASKNRMIPPIGGSKPKEIYKPFTPKLYLQGEDK